MNWFKQIIYDCAWKLDSLCHRVIEWCEGCDSEDPYRKFCDWVREEAK